MLNLPSQQRKAPDELVKLATQEINRILMTIDGVDFVMLCSSDGFELATVNKASVVNSGKIAAVSSSILAMISAFTAEIRLTGCQTITLDAENGKAVLSAVQAKNHPMLIVVQTSKTVLLGMLLHSVKQAADAIIAADARYGS